MIGLESFLGTILPHLVGLALVAYALFLVHRVRRQFFAVVRGWVVISFVVSIAVLWTYETGAALTSDRAWDHHPAVSTTFVALASWLSVTIVGITTRYRRYLSTRAFRMWVAREPLNLIVVWGMIGLAVVALGWIAGPEDAEDLDGHRWLVMLVLTYLGLSISIDFILPVSAKRKGQLRRLSPGERAGIAMLATAWIAIPVIEYTFDMFLIAYTDAAYDAVYSWSMVAMFVFLLKSVTSSRFGSLVVDAEVEMGERGGFRSYDIPRGVYLLEEESNSVAMSLFTELVTRPLRPDVSIPSREESASDTLSFLIPKGLMVTRGFPDRIREEYGLQVTPIIWLTESHGERRVPPTSVALLTDTLARYMESNPNSIVLVDGIEYLLTFNGFDKVVKALDSLNEVTWLTRSRLLITLNPKALSRRELALIERDRIVVRGVDEVEELKRQSEKYGVV